jgi:signal peptidase I
LILIIAFVIRQFFMQPFLIDGQSMEPNFHNNQLILVDKLTYKFKDPQRGDVVVFASPPDPRVYFIKRIIGLPGDDISIRNGNVYVNNEQLREPYLEGQKTLAHGSMGRTLETTVPPNNYFVLGDNRDESSDSRDWGDLPRNNIVGRSWIVIYSPDSQEISRGIFQFAAKEF